MQTTVLHWFRSRQRTLSRVVLALFCVTWLQFAVAPCVMALSAEAGSAAPVAVAVDAASGAPMPDGMVMAPGEHCPYCPPQAPAAGADTQAVCSFPHDPQVDSRVAFATVLMAPPVAPVFFVPAGTPDAGTLPMDALAPVPVSGTPIAVSFCRFLK